MSDILDMMDEFEDGEDLFSGEVDIETLESYEFTESQARELTDAIKSSATATFVLLAQAHQHRADKALGYGSWGEYVRSEFDMSSQRSYQLLDLSKAVAMIEASTPDGTRVKLTEAQARDIKRELPRITEQIRTETQDLTPAEAAARAAEILNEERSEVMAQRSAEAKSAREKLRAEAAAEEESQMASLEAQAEAILASAGSSVDSNNDGMTKEEIEDERIAGLEMRAKIEEAREKWGRSQVDADNDVDAEKSSHLYNFFNLLNIVQTLPDPAELMKMIPDARLDQVASELPEASAWFSRLHTLMELKEV